MTTEQTENQERPEHTLGEVLSRAREERRKSIEEAAVATRVNAKFLQALEADDFEKLPAEVFTRGFIRIYAGYLGLDPDDTYKHYLEQEEIEHVKPVVGKYQGDVIDEEIMDRTSIFIKKKRGKVLPVIILLVILAIFYFLGVFLKSNDYLPDLPETSTDLTAPLIENLPPQLSEPETTSPNPEPQSQPLPEDPQSSLSDIPADEQMAMKSPRFTKLEVADTKPVISEREPAPQEISQLNPAAGSDSNRPEETVDDETENQPALPITVNVATNTPQAQEMDRSSEAVSAFNYVLKADFTDATSVQVSIDGQQPVELSPEAGTAMIWRADKNISLDLEDKKGVSLSLNGNPLPLPEDEEPSITVNIPGNVP